MKIEYDPQVDALYIQFRSIAPGTAGNRRISDDITADYGSDGKLVGLEILDAGVVLGEDAGRVIVEVGTAGAGAGKT